MGSEKDLNRKKEREKGRLAERVKFPPAAYARLQQYRDTGRNTQQVSSKRCNKHC